MRFAGDVKTGSNPIRKKLRSASAASDCALHLCPSVVFTIHYPLSTMPLARGIWPHSHFSPDSGCSPSGVGRRTIKTSPRTLGSTRGDGNGRCLDKLDQFEVGFDALDLGVQLGQNAVVVSNRLKVSTYAEVELDLGLRT